MFFRFIFSLYLCVWFCCIFALVIFCQSTKRRAQRNIWCYGCLSPYDGTRTIQLCFPTVLEMEGKRFIIHMPTEQGCGWWKKKLELRVSSLPDLSWIPLPQGGSLLFRLCLLLSKIFISMVLWCSKPIEFVSSSVTGIYIFQWEIELKLWYPYGNTLFF